MVRRGAGGEPPPHGGGGEAGRGGRRRGDGRCGAAKRRRRGGGATPRRPAAGHWRNHCRSSRHRRHSAAGRWDREAVEERRGAPGSGGLLMGDGAMRATSCRIVRHDVDVAPRHSDLDVAESCCVPQTRGRGGWPHASWCSKYGNRREFRATRGAAKRWRCHTVRV